MPTNKMDIKPIAFIITLTLPFILFAYFLYHNSYALSKDFVAQGRLISKGIETTGSVGDEGSTLALAYKFTFKLDSGEEIQLVNQPFCADLKPGDNVKIFWHKTLFFNKAIYDYCKPLVKIL